MGTKRQKNQLELAFPGDWKGEAPRSTAEGIEVSMARRGDEHPARTEGLMEEIVEEENVKKALRRVRSNRGSPGFDGMTVRELPDYLREHWPEIREQLLAGTYRPQPVQRVEIPKPGGGVRKLGIPTVLDRLIQQAILQVLQPRWDPTFSDSSFGFRPGRSAHQAIARAQAYVAEGYVWVVDLDLEKFFDRVHHDRLMAQVAKRVEDKRLLKLKVNETKSAVDRASKRSFLGFRFTAGERPRRGLAPEAKQRFQQRIRAITRPNRSVSLEHRVAELSRYLTGWAQYFGFCETPSTPRHLDSWVRRRLRCAVWTQWKRGRWRFAGLRRRDVGKDLAARTAGSPHGPWRISRSPALSYAFPNHVFDALGLTRLDPRSRAQPRRTAVYGPVRTAV